MSLQHLLPPNTKAWYDYDDLPQVTTRTFIGIVVAVSGNVLISLALNLQKLAHKRVKERKEDANQDERPSTSDSTLHECEEDDAQPEGYSEDDIFTSPRTQVEGELQPLVLRPEPMVRDYGTDAPLSETLKPTVSSRFNPFRRRRETPPTKYLIPVDILTQDAALHGLPTRTKPKDNGIDAVAENEGDYLKSKLWWIGFLLMNVGEMGNFISYAFAPASVVAPLGTFALIANCFFAPLLLREHFRKRDLLGVAIAMIGAVTVVLASNASDTRLDPEGLIRAISQIPFIIYSGVYIIGAVALATLSEGNIGRNWVFVDIGICALFGGFTVLSTKALSTLLTLQWIEIFTKWITYPLIAVLILTGVGQIRYLNRALMRFDSKVVIPVQFVLFTLSAITGSAILYGDFQKARFHEIVTFLYGCAATFAGVFIIAWTPKDNANAPAADGSADDEAVLNDSAPGSPEQPLGLGTLGRRNRATLILPNNVTPKDSPVLRHQQSLVGMMGISPAQRLLLVHSPPRETVPVPPRYRDEDTRSDIESRGSRTPEISGRRRTMSWYGNESGNHHRNGIRVNIAGSAQRNGGGSYTDAA
ncbi:hypothetical protein HYPSUDRAFT_31621 [Hypholoma sublateritium FD-334 SS-4]|uniref:Uncharacterized protein n=1 Tax=Hypholoma sublateritium (strain FD-334 SS-4) TaxID=945553 RepID=A0A0D2PFY7_HYPSF|nr:hypothetical protein HYPSUDRAFT_31621 [Hypholoma sublateritium FD-334 SS-4]